MREIRPFFLHTRQNNAIDGRLDLEIRKQLALLQQRMRATGQTFGALRKVLSDGAVIVVSASYNGPIPLLRAYVQVPGAKSFEVYVDQLEHGLLSVVKSPSSWALQYPLRIAINESLESHFSGEGIEVACDTSRQESFQGKYSDLNLCPVFSEIPPRISGSPWVLNESDLTYQSHLYSAELLTLSKAFVTEWKGNSEQYSQSAKYTGLMRLAVQALLGTGKYPATICPFSGGIQFGDGIHLDQNYNVYWVRIENDKVLFWRMQLSDIGLEVKNKLSESKDSLTKEQEQWALTFLLSTMVGGSEYQYSAEVDIAGCTEGYNPIAHSWHHSRFTGEAAMVVWSTETIDGVQCFRTKQVHLTFTMPIGEISPPSASCSADSWVEFQIFPGLYNFLVPSSSGYAWIVNGPLDDYSKTEGNEAILYSWFDINDVLQEVTFTTGNPRDIPQNTSYTTGSCVACGGSGSTRTTVGGTSGGAKAIDGGFSAPNFGYSASRAYGTGVSTTRTLSVAKAEPPGWQTNEILPNTDGWIGIYLGISVNSIYCGGSNGALRSNTACGRSCSSPESQAYDDAVAACVGDRSTVVLRRRLGVNDSGRAIKQYEQFSNRLFSDILLIPDSDAEAIFCVSIDTADSYSSYEETWDKPTSGYTSSPVIATSFLMQICQSVDRSVPGVTTCTSTCDIEGPLGVGFSRSCGGGVDGGYGENGRWQTYFLWSEQNPDRVVERVVGDSNGTLVTSNGTFELTPTWQNWSMYVKQDLYQANPPKIVDAWSSFLENSAVYVDGQSEGRKLESAFRKTNPGAFSRWVGNI